MNFINRKIFLVLLLCFCVKCQFLIAQSENVSKKYAIQAALDAEDAYQFSQFGYFVMDLNVAKSNIEVALGSIDYSIRAIDSAIILGLKDSSDLLGIDYATLCKEEGMNAQKILMRALATDDISLKRMYCKKAVFLCGNAIIDAYTASLYLSGGLANKDPKFVFDKNKHLTKLEVDKALYNVLMEDLKTKEDEIVKTISELKQKLTKTTNPKEKEQIQKQIAELEGKLIEVQNKKKEVEQKYNNVDGEIKVQNVPPPIQPETNVKPAFDLKTKQSGDKPSFESNSNDAWGEALILDQKLPPGLFYKVQVGVYKNKLDLSLFQGLTPITGETNPDGIKYSAGMFAKFKDADEAKAYLKENGFPDAFVVAYHDGVKIKIADAVKLEK